MINLTKLNHRIDFPLNEYALDDPNGLLAYGGDLSVPRLVYAYRHGIFPWFSEGEPILWWSPDPRGILHLEQFHCSKSLRKTARKGQFEVTLNQCFDEVIEACADIPRTDAGTWITEAMIDAYKLMHRKGHAQSIEVWQQGNLVGGLYGIAVGKVFCGESMFSYVTDASKIAMLYLVNHLRNIGADFIDCQMQTPHLRSLGCQEAPRKQFLKLLAHSVDKQTSEQSWLPKRLEFSI